MFQIRLRLLLSNLHYQKAAVKFIFDSCHMSVKYDLYKGIYTWWVATITKTFYADIVSIYQAYVR